MSNETETVIPTAEEQTQTAGIIDLYEDAMTIPDSVEKKQTDTEVKEDDSKTNLEPEQKPANDNEFDLTLLELELERHGEKKPLKEFLKSDEGKQWLKEEFQKGWDYEARKNEVKTEKEQFRLIAEGKSKELLQREESFNNTLLKNLALEIQTPLKTLEDFENDLRYENPEEAFREYEESFNNKAEAFLHQVEYAKAVNENNIKEFAESNANIDVNELLQKALPYINASVSMEHVPFPDDTFKVLDRAFNFDKHIAEARADERKKVIAELQEKTAGKQNIPTQTNSAVKQNYTDPNLPDNVRAYEEAFQI